ncbi:DUF4397 domain-containing protein [Longibacter sp.]|uniref:DUF4397 domain-containing protein n=1 Tax=Longibacter sp. TaxID=2045415 RepID=UPI003EBFDBA1
MAALSVAPVVAQNGQVQIFHNVSDPAVSEVDIYIEDSGGAVVESFDNFSYRSATGFLALATGTYDVTVSGPGSLGPSTDVLIQESISVGFQSKQNLTITGVETPSDFSPNPDGLPISLALLVEPNGRTDVATEDGDVEVRVIHNVTDAAAIDILQNGSILADNVSYSDVTSYVSADAVPSTLEITPSDDNSTVLRSLDIDLSTFADEPLVIAASGFLTPNDEPASVSVPPFTLLSITATGTVTDLGAGNIQFVNNSADPTIGASGLDVYINGNRPEALNNLAFRDATPFLNLDTGVYDIAVAPANSVSSGDAFAFFTVTVDAGASLVAVASGVRAPNDFASNPDGESTAFSLLVEEGIRTTASSGAIDVLVHHGSTDAPRIDLLTRQGDEIVGDASYTDFGPYTGIDAQAYTFDVAAADRSDVLASVSADFQSAPADAAILMASGFLDPSANQGGPALALIAVYPDGSVVTFPMVTLPVVINEIDSDTPGSDTEEFVELYNRSPVASVDLDPYVLVLFNGNQTGDPSYLTVDLSAAGLQPEGFFLVGNAAVGGDVTIADGSIQNGADAVALYRAAASNFPNGTFATQSDLQDAIVYGTGDAEDSALLSALGETVQYDEDVDGAKDTESIQRFPNGADTFVVTQPTPGIQNLPVELGTFAATLDGEDVILNWTTLSETNNLRFDIQQRSGNGEFQTIGSVDGAGQSSSLRTYSFRVQDLTAGAHQFRLRQVDVDGRTNLSKSISVTVRLDEPYTLSPVAPHPVTGTGEATLQVRLTQPVTVELFDMLGRRIQSIFNGTVTAESPLSLPINGESLQSGVYFLRVQGQRFETTQRVTVVR